VTTPAQTLTPGPHSMRAGRHFSRADRSPPAAAADGGTWPARPGRAWTDPWARSVALFQNCPTTSMTRIEAGVAWVPAEGLAAAAGSNTTTRDPMF
jgi:hypothetical protein